MGQEQIFTFCCRQLLEISVCDTEASHARKTLRGSKEGPKVNLVFFLGGITYAEIAALRFVSAQIAEQSGRRLIIGTTAILNGKKAVGVAVEKRTFGG